MTNAQDMAFRLLIKLDPEAAKREADKIREAYRPLLGIASAQSTPKSPMKKPKLTTGPCWNCKTEQPLYALRGVRLTKCPCGAVHPHLTKRLVLGFFNPDKTGIYL